MKSSLRMHLCKRISGQNRRVLLVGEGGSFFYFPFFKYISIFVILISMYFFPLGYSNYILCLSLLYLFTPWGKEWIIGVGV